MSELNLINLNIVLQNSKNPVLIMFKTKWCRMCRVDEILIDEYCKNNKNKLEVYSIDVDSFNLWREYENPDYQIDKVPSYKIYYNSQIIWNSNKSINYFELDNVLNTI